VGTLTHIPTMYSGLVYFRTAGAERSTTIFVAKENSPLRCITYELFSMSRRALVVGLSPLE
jgi:hypothetical protein